MSHICCWLSETYQHSTSKQTTQQLLEIRRPGAWAHVQRAWRGLSLGEDLLVSLGFVGLLAIPNDRGQAKVLRDPQDGQTAAGIQALLQDLQKIPDGLCMRMKPTFGKRQ